MSSQSGGKGISKSFCLLFFANQSNILIPLLQSDYEKVYHKKLDMKNSISRKSFCRKEAYGKSNKQGLKIRMAAPNPLSYVFMIESNR